VSTKLTEEEVELLKGAGYSETVIELYRNKINIGIMKDPDVNLAYTGPCGDTMKLYLKISDEDVVEDAKFQYLGCPGAASSGSAMTRIVKGRTLEEAKRITEYDILLELGGLPESKLDCPKLAVATLQKAITKYEEHKRRRSNCEFSCLHAW
jgi:NifU-like protein involved in Fe-S cluster formation